MAVFDSVNHRILLVKLWFLSIIANVHDWYKNGLSSPFSAILHGGLESQQFPFILNVFQGSVLYSVLFILWVPWFTRLFIYLSVPWFTVRAFNIIDMLIMLCLLIFCGPWWQCMAHILPAFPLECLPITSSWICINQTSYLAWLSFLSCIVSSLMCLQGPWVVLISFTCSLKVFLLMISWLYLYIYLFILYSLPSQNTHLAILEQGSLICIYLFTVSVQFV